MSKPAVKLEKPKLFKLFSSNRKESHHIMKISHPSPVVLTEPLRIRRKEAMVEEEVKIEELDIRVGGEKYDASKVAGEIPLKKTGMFKKKMKTSFFGRDGDEIRGLQKQEADPDANPYIMNTGDHEYEGNVEGAQQSCYVLFMLKVLPSRNHDRRTHLK